MVTDRVYATLQAGYRIGCTSIERIRKEVMFLNNHRNDDRATYLSTIERLRSLRSGFLPTSAILYDWELDPDTYLSDREKELLRPYINTGYEKVTRNKLLFQQLVAPRFEDQLPTVYGVVTSDRVLSTDGSVITESAAIWLETTVRENNVVVCKPAHSSGGTGVVIFRSNSGTLTANGDTTGASEAVQLLSERAPYLVTEYVEQHSYSESIYSDAVNTLRILVYRNPRTCETFIPQAIHRFGTDASAPVDNWDKGGLSAQIDLETGELGKAALPPNSDTVNWTSTHPDTGAEIEGVQIPMWDDVLDTTMAMSNTLSYYDLLAWDIVLTDNGMVALEANEWPTVSMMQVHEPLLSDIRVREFYNTVRPDQS